MMDYRSKLNNHMKRFPLDVSEYLNGTHSAYGMDLFVEEAFISSYFGLARKYLRVKNFYSYRDEQPSPDLVDFVVIWGVSEKDINSLSLFDFACKHNKPILIIEDGFLRSFFPMTFGEISCSIRYDNVGCYYDSNYKSAIENLLNSDSQLLQDTSFCQEYISRIVDKNITKYCYGKLNSLPKDNNYVLVVDQVFGDMSIIMSGVDDSVFDLMLETALIENPNSIVLVKMHPEAIFNIRFGHYDITKLTDDRIKVISESINSIFLIKQVEKVYCVSTQMGFEALLCGKEVHVFGKPFYSGWGLTKDRLKIDRRYKARSLSDLFYASYIYNTMYINPLTTDESSLGELLDYFVEYGKNENYLNSLKHRALESKIYHLEKKISEIEPLKQATIAFDYHINQIKENYSIRFGFFLFRLKQFILRLINVIK